MTEPHVPTLQALRGQNNQTQRDVAYALGVTEKTVQRWESGDVLPRLRHRRKLAKRFGVSIEALGFDSD
jgi:DNA-binding XRE family transcriptional regulator